MEQDKQMQEILALFRQLTEEEKITYLAHLKYLAGSGSDVASAPV